MCATLGASRRPAGDVHAAEIEELKFKCQNLQDMIKIKDGLIQDNVRNNFRTQQKLMAQEEEIAMLTEENASLKVENKKVTDENVELNQKVEIFMVQNISNMDAKMQLASIIEQLKEENQKLTDDNAELKTINPDISSMPTPDAVEDFLSIFGDPDAGELSVIGNEPSTLASGIEESVPSAASAPASPAPDEEVGETEVVDSQQSDNENVIFYTPLGAVMFKPEELEAIESATKSMFDDESQSAASAPTGSALVDAVADSGSQAAVDGPPEAVPVRSAAKAAKARSGPAVARAERVVTRALFQRLRKTPAAKAAAETALGKADEYLESAEEDARTTKGYRALQEEAAALRREIEAANAASSCASGAVAAGAGRRAGVVTRAMSRRRASTRAA